MEKELKEFNKNALAYLALGHVGLRAMRKIYKMVEQQSTQSNEKEQITKPTIYIVTGLPRSGTSMMMKILTASGIEALIDNKRIADQNNMEGYFEYEPVKSIQKDNSFLKLAVGKCIKVIAHLVPFLSQDYNYKIINMKRDIDEILDSQEKMLDKKDAAKRENLKDIFTNQMKVHESFMQKSNNIDFTTIHYSDCILNSEATVKIIAEFIEKPGKQGEMLRAINPILYRNRK